MNELKGCFFVATAKKTTAKKPTKAKKDVVEDAVIVETDAIVEESIDDAVSTNEDNSELQAPVEEAAAPVEPQSETQKSPSVLPLILGGVLSGAVGFGAATYYFMNQPSDDAQALAQVQTTLKAHDKLLEGVDGTINELHAGLGEATQATETGFKQTITRNEALATRLDEITTAIVAFEARLTTLAKRPIADAAGIAGDAAKAYERELQAMRTEIEKLAAEATARIEGVAKQAATSEETAAATAKTTNVQVAVSQLQSALDNGGAFEAVVANLAGVGVDVPAVFASAAKAGVPTLIDLQESFPAAARAGLGASVKATSGDDTMSKIGSFFRSQVGARSLEPREGDDPDAVLSRAEAALGKGDIAGAIALISALPEAGQMAMADFASSAKTRNEAVEALRVLADSLNGN